MEFKNRTYLSSLSVPRHREILCPINWVNRNSIHADDETESPIRYALALLYEAGCYLLSTILGLEVARPIDLSVAENPFLMTSSFQGFKRYNDSS